MDKFIALANYYLEKNKIWKLSFEDLDRMFMLALAEQMRE